MKTITFVCVLLLCSIVRASILFVPSQFSSPTNAIHNANSGDTIILAPAIYTDTVTINNPLTIASRFLFTQDSTDIDSTIWQAEPNRPSIYANGNGSENSLRFTGISFRAQNAAQSGRAAIHDTNLTLVVDHCVFIGAFGSPEAIIYVSGNCDVSLTNDQCEDDDNSQIWLWAQQVQWANIVQCSLLSVTTGFLQQHAIRAFADSINMDSCFFANRDLVARLYPTYYAKVTNSIFVNFSSDAFRLVPVSASFATPSRLTNCIFRNSTLHDSGGNEVISIPSGDDVHQPVIENCTFENIVEQVPTPISEIIYSNAIGSIYLRRCIFRDNVISGQSMLLLNVAESIDSCQFIRNQINAGLIQNASSVPQEINVSNCDFVGNSEPILFYNVNSASAPNCYWGSASGPHCSVNPAGQGQTINSSINPVPFRTSPVFPEDGVSERGVSFSLPNSIELFPAYPNPFNSDVTIRYSLPRAEPVVVTVWNEFGQLVTTLSDARLQSSGNHSVRWSPNALASGRYFLRVNTPMGRSGVMSMVYVK